MRSPPEHSNVIGFVEVLQRQERNRKARKYGFATWEAFCQHLDENTLDPDLANDPQYRACMLEERRNFLHQTFEWL